MLLCLDPATAAIELTAGQLGWPRTGCDGQLAPWGCRHGRHSADPLCFDAPARRPTTTSLTTKHPISSSPNLSPPSSTNVSCDSGYEPQELADRSQRFNALNQDRRNGWNSADCGTRAGVRNYGKAYSLVLFDDRGTHAVVMRRTGNRQYAGTVPPRQ